MSQGRLTERNEKKFIGAALKGIVNETINYHHSNHPLTDKHKIHAWNFHIAPQIKESIKLLSASGYRVNHLATNRVEFIVPDWKLGIRWVSGDSHGFILCPHQGQFATALRQIGEYKAKAITQDQLFECLDINTVYAVRDWANIAADLSDDARNARRTIEELLDIIKTVGQLKRMVPELIQYMPDNLKEALDGQLRRSPFPSEWAAFDKSKIERLLLVLAKGHLVGSIAKSKAKNADFDWAERTPEGFSEL